MNRQYLISTVRSYRDQLLGMGAKRSADVADELLETILDAGREWHLLVPRVHSLVDLAERHLRNIHE